MNMLPTEYSPQTIDEFFGPAKATAQRLVNAAKMCMPSGAPCAFLFAGPSGAGKSALAKFAMTAFDACFSG